ncbi:MAG: PAS domain S-box protein, partial [Chloroflexi bacterium]|nr:PAS domain S-box protein [Chloroflexota bacterium]
MASKKSISISEDQTFRLMFENQTAVMLLTAPQTGHILEANSAALGFYGYPKAILYGMSIDEINALPAEQVAVERQKALDDGRNSFIIPQRLANGEERIVEVNSSLVDFQHQQVSFSIFHDITAYKQLQESLLTYQLCCAAELVIANKEIAFQNEEKANRAAELVIANKELVFQDEEKANRAAELIVVKKLALHSEEKAKQTEALNIANGYLENLINYANAPIIVWDTQFRITRFNHAFESLTGHSEAQLLGQTLEVLFPPALVSDSMAQIRKTVSGERWETVEIAILHCDASIRTVLWNSATVFGSDGRTPIATIAQGQDITERKRAELELLKTNIVLQNTVHQLTTHQIALKMQNEELHLSQEQVESTRTRYFDLYDLAPVGYCTVSEKGLILEANLTAASLLGVPKTAIIKRPFSLFIVKEHQNSYYMKRKSLIEAENQQSFDLKMRKNDGTSFWARLETSAALDTNGAPMFKVVISDITEQKRAETQVKERLKELSCLNDVSRLAFDPNLTEAELCQQVAERLIGALGFPEIATAMVELNGQCYQTAKYANLHFAKLTAPILFHAQKCGQISVCYAENKPFVLPEEQDLLDNIANVLGLWHERIISDRDVRKLSQAVEQSPASIMISDPNGTIEYANPYFCALTGYTLDEIVGENARILQTGYTSKLEYQQLWETLLSGKTWVGKFLNRKKDGVIYWEKASIAPMFDEAGKIAHFLAVKEDITARKIMEIDLRQSESHNRALLSAIPDMIFRIRREGIILDYKATLSGPLFAPQSQLVGKSIFEFLDETVADKVRNYIQHTLQSKQVQTLEIDFKLRDTIHVLEVRFKDLGEHEVVAIVRDISEQSRLEQMKSDFINRASHELRTPITTMLLMASLLDETINKDGINEYWDILKSELSRERLLVEHLLRAVRLENDQELLSFRSIEIDELIKQIVHDFGPAAKEKNITISTEIIPADDRSPRLVQADQSALTQVFVNLVGNAIKYTPSGGEVSIRTHSEKLGTQISISDNGLGIPAKDLPLLFNRFFRGSNAIEDEIQGTGLGLFIVRSILEKHDGNIQVTSELGK